jgi:hypothetical protein
VPGRPFDSGIQDHPHGPQERSGRVFVPAPPVRGAFLTLRGLTVAPGRGPPVVNDQAVVKRQARLGRVLVVFNLQSLDHGVIDHIQESVDGESTEIDTTAGTLSIEFMPDSGPGCPFGEPEDGCVGRSPYSSNTHSITALA